MESAELAILDQHTLEVTAFVTMVSMEIEISVNPAMLAVENVQVLKPTNAPLVLIFL